MKRLIALIILATSLNVAAFELQCHTDRDNLDIVIKTSPQTGVTYMIPIVGDTVTPIPLKPKRLLISDRYVFYKSDSLKFIITIDDGDGLVLVEGDEPIVLSNCKMTDGEQ